MNDKLGRALDWLVRICGGLAAFTGLVWTALWLAGVAARWSAEGAIVPKTNMALAMMMGGASLLLASGPSASTKRRLTATVLAVLVILIGGLTLSEHLFGYDLGIDQILASEPPGASATAAPNRLGPPGSLSLALLGAGLLALSTLRRKPIPYLGLAVCLINLTPLVGFLYGIADFYRRPSLTGIAWSTVLAMTALGLGLVGTQRDSGPMAMLLRQDAGGAFLRRFLAPVILVPLGLGFVWLRVGRETWFDVSGAIGLLVISLIVIFAAIVWRYSAHLGGAAAARAAAEAAVRESEQRYRGVVENTTAIILRLDPRGVVTFANQYALQFFGYTAEELIGKHAVGTFVPERETTGRDLTAMVNAIMANPAQFHTNANENLCKDGRRVWLEWTNSGVYDANGNLKELVAVGIDATERNAAREALGKSEERYRMLHETMRDAFVQVDMDGRIMDCNDAYCQMLGYSPEEIRILTYQQVTPERWHDFEAALVRDQIIARGYSDVYEKEYRRKDGTIFPVELRTVLARDAAGQPVAMWGIVRDITERKQAEEELEKQRKQLWAIIESLDEAVGVWNADGRLVLINDATAKLYGFEMKEQMLRHLSDFADVQVRTMDGCELPQEEWPPSRVLRGDTFSNWELEQYIPSINKRFIGSNSGGPVRDANGKIILGVTSVRDITEQKQAEEALRESEERFRSMVEQAPLGVAVVDSLNAHFDVVNPALARMIGRTVEELQRTDWVAITHPDDIQGDMDRMAAMNAGKIPGFQMEKRYRRPDGSYFWVNITVAPMYVTDKTHPRHLLMVENIDARKQAEAELTRTRGQLAEAQKIAHLGSFEYVAATRITLWSEEEYRIYGLDPAEPSPAYDVMLAKYIHPDDTALLHQSFSAALQSHSVYELEHRIVRPDGSVRWVYDRALPYLDDSGRLLRYVGATLDITERKKAHEALAAAQRQVQSIIDNATSIVYALDLEERFLLANTALAELLNSTPEQMIGRRRHELMPQADADWHEANDRQVIEAGKALEFEEQSDLPDRSITWLTTKFPLRDAQGRIYAVGGISADITDRKHAEEALRESEKRLARAQEMAHLGNYEMDVVRDRIVWSDEVYRIFGFKPGEFEATHQAFLEAVHPEDRAAVDAAFMDSVREGRDSFEFEYRIIRRDNGETRHVHTKSENLRYEKGRIVRSIGMVHDITEQRKTEALRRSLAEQERLRLGAAVEQASDSVAMFDLDGTIRYVNASFESLNRTSRDKAVGRSYFDLVAGEPSAEAIHEAITQGKIWAGSLSRRIPEGRPLELEVTISPAKDPAGTIIGGLATEADVTERNALQHQIRQAQKMEALGTLAGGITHDFNNILGAIIINTELALLDLDLLDPGRRTLPIVLQAANRGKELVKQIITFSRQRAWERKPLEIAPIIKEGMGLLRSTLPKEISVHEKIDSRSGIVLADPSHIHQILVNFCQNAALAMRDCGGDLEVGLGPVEVDETLAVRHPDLKPGPYVRLTITDSGCGMTKEIVERIFEPFFTTREQGKGSGLGLAVVHGIVKSYGGAIIVYSEPGKGSVFSTYLPRLEGEVAAVGTSAAGRPIKGDERILLVEDEEAQRRSLVQGLGHLGYQVKAKAEGRSALAAFEKDPGAFDLVITDQIMPRMSGLELASALVKIRPDIPIILCTGFSEKVNGGTVGKDGIREIIMKPFTLTEITRQIRRIFSPRSGSPA